MNEAPVHVRDHSRTACWCNPSPESYVRYTGRDVRAAVVKALRDLAAEAYELPYETGVSRFIDARADDIESGEYL